MFKNFDWLPVFVGALILTLVGVIIYIIGYVAWDINTQSPTGKYEVVSSEKYIRSVKPFMRGCKAVMLDENGGQFEARGSASACDQITPGQIILLDDGEIVSDFWTGEIAEVN